MNNTKKSKFQQRLDEVAKKYHPEGNRRSINDKVNLHKMDDVSFANELRLLIITMKFHKIPPQSLTRQSNGVDYNDGVEDCIQIIERRIDKIFKQGT